MKHKHAELMALYARDASETETPWERWEYKPVDRDWIPMDGPTRWEGMGEYRRKPDDLSEAVALATAIRDRCYPEATDWKPESTVSGVLSQISNMVEGMEPDSVHDTFVRSVTDALDKAGAPTKKIGGKLCCEMFSCERIAWLGERVRELERNISTQREVANIFEQHVKTALDNSGAPTHHPDIGAPARKPMMPSERIDWLGKTVREYGRCVKVHISEVGTWNEDWQATVRAAAPKGYGWAAMDEDGRWFAYSKKPKKFETAWITEEGGTFRCFRSKAYHRWQDSLIEL